MAQSRLLRYLPFSAATTALQATTYLLGISLFSIAFLVFLNSSISFVVTDLVGVKQGVGDIVGTLGFTDEVVALVACPVWGLVSDRLGVRSVAVIGYTVIGLALFVLVQARHVYPQLLLARILFAVGATAAATMVTAILPCMTDESSRTSDSQKSPNPARNSLALSLDSQATITPERFLNHGAASSSGRSGPCKSRGGPSALAGYVGFFTGCGALVALLLFLPLPTRFGRIDGVTLGQAVEYSFYVVGAVSFLVAAFVFFGLRNLNGEDGKGWRTLLALRNTGTDESLEQLTAEQKIIPYLDLLKDSVRLGFSDSQIALGYLGGFVARASTVAISLFVPLFINSFFISKGFCHGAPNDPSPALKKECEQAYTLAAAVSGVAQLSGLVCAPVFGYVSSRPGRINYPVVVATVLGIVGYVMIPQLPSPELRNTDGRGGSPIIMLYAALIGISQIGAIVCSLGSLGRGVLTTDVVNVVAGPDGAQQQPPPPPPRLIVEAPDAHDDTAPLLDRPEAMPEDAASRIRLKGSIAGVYSWCGGAAILLLTKLGGYLFDAWSVGAPFYLMAAFNGVLLVTSLAMDAGQAARERAREAREHRR
ncbi:hypothetical protein P8C59_000404 [Phyllachora maydis]|uniref:MFS transporter n=1 Tax=Phyllachora maydis TaxID=1825666 RepID=A0AAD9M6C5_9PEZI|nr:hypothetical protein P8C59_000404 [Phyllachora maydis]